MQREPMFRLLVGVTMGVSAAAAVIAGIRETPTPGQLMCLVLAAGLAAVGTYMVTEAPTSLLKKTPLKMTLSGQRS